MIIFHSYRNKLHTICIFILLLYRFGGSIQHIQFDFKLVLNTTHQRRKYVCGTVVLMKNYCIEVCMQLQYNSTLFCVYRVFRSSHDENKIFKKIRTSILVYSEHF